MAIINGLLDKAGDFFGGVGDGLTKPKGSVGDWRHAARLFTDDTFRLAPKQKYLFFVNFEINPEALVDFAQIKEKHIPELNMLCKSADLPQYSASIDVKNQYNRKKVIQTSIEYTPVNITMHDDNQGITSYLLEAYYKYYFRDSSGDSREAAYQPRNTYSSERKFRYGLDNGTVIPFFKNIRIFQLSRKQYTEFTLVNPLIERWGHDAMNSTDSAGIAENNMVINYESVLYSRGNIDDDIPATFATSHYDKTPSPLKIEGGGTSTLLGEGGVLSGGKSVLGDIASGEAGLGTALSAFNTVKNAKDLSKEGLKSEALGVASGAALQLALTGQVAGPLGTVINPVAGAVGTAGRAIGSFIPGLGAGDEETIATPPDGRGSNTPGRSARANNNTASAATSTPGRSARANNNTASAATSTPGPSEAEKTTQARLNAGLRPPF